MKRGIIAVLVLGLFLLAGCAKGPVCNEPYIQVGNDCCLDKNSNAICDKDDTAAPEAPIAEPEAPSAAETPEVALSEQPNMEKFNEFLSNAYLGKLALGVQVGPPNFPVKAYTFSKATDQLCTSMEIKKTILAGSIAIATYDTTAKTYAVMKTSFPMELKQGGSSGCETIDLPAGKYERKLYIDDVLVAVLPFEVKA